MKELKRIFAEKKTENGDIAYNTTGKKLVDILFMSQYYREHLNEVKIGNTEKDKLFAMFMRDPRNGIGERDLGRVLMSQTNISPEEVVKVGRCDDLLHLQVMQDNLIDTDYLGYFIKLLKSEDYNAKKWSPRLNSGTKSKKIAKVLMKIMGIKEKEYRKLIKCDTTEYRVSNGVEVDYSKVPSLSFLKHNKTFQKQDAERFAEFMESVNKGESKINTGTMTPYDIFKNFVKCSGWSGNVNVDPQADIIFKQLEQINLGSILPIVDNSGSMYDSADSQGKAKAIAHYVAKNSTYMNNHIVSFSNNPKLIELGNTYEEDMKALCSYDDVANTDFGKVMELLGKLKEDIPEYLLVLSDMEFDYGSSMSKEQTMKYFKKNGFKTKIIWWNFNTRNTTSPELDEHGNVFMSGYSPQLLQFLESGFDGEKFLDKLLEEYKKKIA
ncbi:MAG: DUF2828 family protein [Paraclostridium sp.]